MISKLGGLRKLIKEEVDDEEERGKVGNTSWDSPFLRAIREDDNDNEEEKDEIWFKILSRHLLFTSSKPNSREE